MLKGRKKPDMKFVRREEEDYSLKLTALIDVVFLLLIFFMVSTAFVDFTRQVDIELPESASGAPTPKTKVYTIEINRDGGIFLNGQETDLLDLPGGRSEEHTSELQSH